MEFKNSTRRRTRSGFLWIVNVHRHGKLDERFVDYYVIRLEKFLGLRASLYLVIPAPLNVKVPNFTWGNVLTRWHSYIGRFDLIGGRRSRVY